MQSQFISNRQITYDGRQLAPHWIYRNFDILGDAIVAFIGPCQVDLSEMVDIEDVKAQAPIYSPSMLHCIVEFFHNDLELAVYRQRLLNKNQGNYHVETTPPTSGAQTKTHPQAS